MKKGLLIIGLLAATVSFAQKKPKISQAENALKANDLATAKQVIDACSADEKLSTKSRTWFLKGIVYAALDTAGNQEGDISLAMDAFKKTTELKGGTNEEYYVPEGGIPSPQSIIVGNFWAHYINKGVANFESNPKQAVIDFDKSLLVMPDSIVAYYYGGLVSLTLEDYDKSLNSFMGYIENGGTDMDAYDRALYIISNIKKDHERALKVIETAKKVNPTSKVLGEWQFRALYALNRVDEAVNQLEETSKREPNNPELQFNLGVIKDNLEKPDESMVHYKKALAIDPDYFNANFNLGVLYRNQIVEKSNEKNGLGYSKADLAKAKEIDTQIQDIAKTSLPYWEKCRFANPNDQTTLETLQYLYMQLKDYDNAEKIKARIEELGYN